MAASDQTGDGAGGSRDAILAAAAATCVAVCTCPLGSPPPITVPEGPAVSVFVPRQPPGCVGSNAGGYAHVS